MNKPHLLLRITIIAILILSSLNVTATVRAQASATPVTDWHVTVTGLVDHPLNLTLSDLEAMPQTVVTAALYCVDSGSTPIYTNSSWAGVQISTLLDLAGASPSAVKVVFNASDGYTTDLDMTTAMSGNVILAYSNAGEPLVGTLRLVVPDHWGYKWISQVTSITLVNYDFKGTWESQGYPDNANIQYSPSPPNSVDSTTNSTSTNQNNSTKPTSTFQPTNSTTTPPPNEPESSTSEPATAPSGNLAELVAFVIVAVAVGACLLTYGVKRHNRQNPSRSS